MSPTTPPGCTGDCDGSGYFDKIGRFYDRYRPVDPARTAQETGVLLRALEAERPGTAEDLMCAQGRHTQALAEAGWHVTAVDGNQELLDRLTTRADGTPWADRIDVVRADVYGYRPTGPVDLVTVLGNSFGFGADRRTCEQALRHWAEALGPSGHVALELFSPHQRQRRSAAGGTIRHTFPGGWLHKTPSWNACDRTEHCAVEFSTGELPERSCYRQYLPAADDLTELASAAGLRHRASLGAAQGWPSDDSQLHLLGRRQ